MWTGFFLQTSAIVYYYTAVIGNKELSVTIATIMSIVPMAANFLVPALAGRMGKNATCMWAVLPYSWPGWLSSSLQV